MDVIAIYFPSFHQDALYDQWYGEGWNEWRLMEEAQPLFEGHEQPKLCSWGAFDEADPQWMAKQIDLAADHGVTSFNFDWYWYSGQKLLHRALEDGFLKAPNRERLKFFVMWANHTWGVFPAMRDRFNGHIDSTDTRSHGQALSYDKPLIDIRHSIEDLIAVTEYCAEHYFHEPNYHCLGGKPIFSFWRWDELEKQLGGIDAVAAGFEAMNEVARRHGFDGLHIKVNIACYEGPETTHCWWPALIERAKQAGADSVYGYNAARTDGFEQLTNDRPLVPYDDVIQSHRDLFSLSESRGLPFHPVATIGFDNTPRWHRGAKLPLDFRKHHYEPIVVDTSPEKFKQTLRVALDSIERSGGEPRMLYINAWNEWPEGNTLLPDQRYGTAYLEALREVLATRAAPTV